MLAAALMAPAAAVPSAHAAAGQDVGSLLRQSGFLLPGRYEKRDLDVDGP
jgi:hypothetical protein